MAEMIGKPEFRVLIYVVRRTLGYKKRYDKISIGQMHKGIKQHNGTVLNRGTGLSKASIVRAVANLEKQGYITRTKGKIYNGSHTPTTYGLCWMKEATTSSRTETTPLSHGESTSSRTETAPLSHGETHTSNELHTLEIRRRGDEKKVVELLHNEGLTNSQIDKVLALRVPNLTRYVREVIANRGFLLKKNPNSIGNLSAWLFKVLINNAYRYQESPEKVSNRKKFEAKKGAIESALKTNSTSMFSNTVVIGAKQRRNRPPTILKQSQTSI